MNNDQFKEMAARVLVVAILVPLVAGLMWASLGIFIAIARMIITAVD